MLFFLCETRHACIGLKENYAFTDNKQNEPSAVTTNKSDPGLAKRCSELSLVLDRCKSQRFWIEKMLKKSPKIKSSQRIPSNSIPTSYEKKLAQQQYRTNAMVQRKHYEMLQTLQRQRDQDTLRIATASYEAKFRYLQATVTKCFSEKLKNAS